MQSFLISAITVIVSAVSVASTSPSNLIPLPLTRQATDYTCGAAAVQSIVGYYGENIRESALAKALRTNPTEGTHPNNIISYARKRGYAVTVTKDCSLDKLKAMLDQKMPVLVLIQAWADNPKVNYATDWADGHYVVAVGYDEKNIYFMDPCTLGNYTFIPTTEFVARWHDTARGVKYNHFAMTMTKPKPGFDPKAIQKME